MKQTMTEVLDDFDQQSDNDSSHSSPTGPGQGILSSTENEFEEKRKLLQRIGCLQGFRVDNINGPEETTRSVARFVGGGSPFVEEVYDVLTEAITGTTEREANYVHHGWSTGTVATCSPWTSSRIAANNQANPAGAWVTRRTLVLRLSVRLSIGELAPVPEFEDAIKEALKQPTVFGQFRAVYSALLEWGDVVPLAVDLGTSLALTDLEANMSKLPEKDYYYNTYDLSTIKTARLTRQGIPEDVQPGWLDGEWLNKQVPQHHWRKIRISAVISTLSLLSAELQNQLSQLYAKRLSYVPPLAIGPVGGSSRTHDDTNHASHEISSIIVYATDFVRSLTFIYKNGTRSKHQGTDSYGAEHEFILTNGEFITEMLIWGEDWVRGLQFITNFGRCSPHFGGGGTIEHIPTVARTRGGVLVGANTLIKQFGGQGYIIHKLQGIWRHDLIGAVPKEDDVFSDYIGAKVGGFPFNDRVVVRNLDMAISNIKIRCDTVINSIQLMYTENTNGGPVEIQAAPHGGHGGKEKSFELEPGEHIVEVWGWYDNERITQLHFTTDRGK